MDKKKNSNGPENSIIKPETLKKKNLAERKAVELLNANPDKNNFQLGKDLKELGLTRDGAYINKRLKRSEILSLELAKVRQRNAEILAKRIVPKALNLHEKALNRKLSKEDKKDPVKVAKHEAEQFKYIKLAEDKEFGGDDSKRPPMPQTVNIQAIRTMIYNDMTKDEEPIDITEEDN